MVLGFGNPSKNCRLRSQIANLKSPICERFSFRLSPVVQDPRLYRRGCVDAGLGIGANTAVFSFLNALLLRALPYREAGRLVAVWSKHPGGGLNVVSPADFLDWQKQSGAFTHMAAYSGDGFNLWGTERTERIAGARVSTSLFPLLGTEPVLGRTFQADEDTPQAPRVAVLSHRLWQERFNGDTNVLGQTIRLNEQPHTIVGVMPAGFRFLTRQPQVWIPLALDTHTQNRDYHFLLVFARLQPGVTQDLAQTEMNTIASRLAQLYPDTNRDWGAQVVSLREFFLNPTNRLAVLIVFGVVIRCPAHCLCERGQSVPGAGRGTRTRTRHPRGFGCQSRAASWANCSARASCWEAWEAGPGYCSLCGEFI